MKITGKNSGDKKIRGIKFLSKKSFKLMTEDKHYEILGYTNLKKYKSDSINELLIENKKINLYSETNEKRHCIGYLKIEDDKYVIVEVPKKLKAWYALLALLSPMTVTAATVVTIVSVSAIVINETKWLSPKENVAENPVNKGIQISENLPYDDNVGETKLDIGSFASYVSAGITYDPVSNSIIKSIIGNSSYNVLDCYFKVIIDGKECFSLKDNDDIKSLKPNQYIESFKLTKKPDTESFDKAIIRYYAEYEGEEYYLTDIEVKVNIKN